MLMVMYMRGIGLMIKLMAMGFIHIWMELGMKVNGKKINSMEKVRNHGLMELFMTVII